MDVEVVRSVQVELDKVIEEGVGNIVQLLRNTESGISSGVMRVDDDAFEVKNRQMNRFRRWPHEGTEEKGQGQARTKASWTPSQAMATYAPGKGRKSFMDFTSDLASPERGGRLSDQLIAKGLLTKNMISQLRREWEEASAEDGKKGDGRDQ